MFMESPNVWTGYDHLHPEKYAKDALDNFELFIHGKINYPEIDLKLAGDEAWSDAFPELRKAIHDLVLLIRREIKANGVPDGTPVPESVRQKILQKAKKKGILKVLEQWANGQVNIQPW